MVSLPISYYESQRVMLTQYFGVRMAAQLIQRYGILPIKRAMCIQPFGVNPMLRAMCILPISSNEQVRNLVEQYFGSFEEFRVWVNQPFSIAESQQRAMLTELFMLAETDEMRQQVEQIFAIAAGGSVRQRIAVPVYVVTNGETHLI